MRPPSDHRFSANSLSNPGGFALFAKLLSWAQAISRDVGKAVPLNWTLLAGRHHHPFVTSETASVFKDTSHHGATDKPSS